MRRTRGFTLLEMTVALVVLSILTTLAIVTFSAARGNVVDTKSREALRAVASQEEQYFRQRGAFQTDPAQMTSIDSSFSYATGASANSSTVSLSTGDNSSVLGLAMLGDSGKCYALTVSDPTASGTDSSFTFIPDSTHLCSGDQAKTGSGQAW